MTFSGECCLRIPLIRALLRLSPHREEYRKGFHAAIFSRVLILAASFLIRQPSGGSGGRGATPLPERFPPVCHRRNE